MARRIRNSTKICRSLWQHPLDSRADLAKRLGIDKSTITSETTDLIKRNVICELPKSRAMQNSGTTGRRPIPLSLNKDYGTVLGISIQAGSYALSAVNLAGEAVFSQEVNESITKDNITDEIIRIQRDFIREHGQTVPRCLGIGIGVGGLINWENNTIRYSVPLDVREEFSFIDEIHRKTSLPVSLENNANCCAWAKLAFPKNPPPRNFLFLLVEFKQALVPHKQYGGVGIGLGIVINGKIHYGVHSFAGEFRSVFCSERNENQTSLNKAETDRILTDQGVMTRFINELAANIAMFSNTLDIGKIFISSDLETPGRQLCDVTRKALSDNWIFPVEKEVPVDYSSYGANMIAYGAAGKLFQVLFDSGRIP
jgi:hypothetical protein